MRQVLFAALVVAAGAPAAAQDKKAPAVIKLQIPDAPTRTEVTIEGKKMPEPAALPKDGLRVFNTPDLEPGKTYAYKIETVIVPNNYTQIFRTREVTFKAGDTVAVDVRTEDKATPDRIVVRWVPTPDAIVDEMCKLAKVTKDDVVHDYGCGDAVMLIRPVTEFKAKKGYGVEIDPKMVAKAQENIAKFNVKDKVTVVQGDILKLTDKDCADATVVLLYIGDDLGTKLGPVLQKALKPGARVVSHRFKLGDWKPEKTVTVQGPDGDEYVLHLWIIPEKK